MTSGAPSELRRFAALHPDVDVRWLDMGSQEVYDRVRSEKANPTKIVSVLSDTNVGSVPSLSSAACIPIIYAAARRRQCR